MRDNFFYWELGLVGDLGEGVEVWRGYYLSVRLIGLGLIFNFDIIMIIVLKFILVEEFFKERFIV